MTFPLALRIQIQMLMPVHVVTDQQNHLAQWFIVSTYLIYLRITWEINEVHSLVSERELSERFN